MEYLGNRSYDALMKTLNADPKTIHDMVKGIYTSIRFRKLSREISYGHREKTKLFAD